VTGPALGTQVNYFSVENLIGNAGDDYFALSDGAGLSGYLWDQGGNATLDYSAYTTGVYVNLATSEATNIAGGVYGIPNVVGGAGDDILVGDDSGNYLAGGPGRDLLIGGGAGYSGAADYLVGGEGEDIVIGGFTAYDTDGGALAAILAEWTQPTDYAERVANLYSGATAPALNEETVFYNYSYGNVLLGEAELDLFFGDASYDASDWDPETETFIPVF